MAKAEESLKEAFAGESQANRKYLAFAAKADQEGYAQVARLFRAAAEAETVHAHNHLRALKGIRGTKENLQEAIGGETHEFKKMYPEMIQTTSVRSAGTLLKKKPLEPALSVLQKGKSLRKSIDPFRRDGKITS
jgi:rubrerythrin